MKGSCLVTLLVAGAVTFECAAGDEPETEIATSVVGTSTAQTRTFDWGRLSTYFSGETRSTADALTAIAVVNPGMQIHPPHVHAEEEYLMVLEGEGTWTVKGKRSPAREGDLLYAAPWDEHGIENTGESPMKFLFLKWNPKAVAPMEKPGK